MFMVLIAAGLVTGVYYGMKRKARVPKRIAKEAL